MKTFPAGISPAVMLGLLFLCTACSNQAARTPTYSVEGKVYWKDNTHPAANAFVVFRPLENASLENWPAGYPRSTVDKDGTFKLGTYEKADGAPAGRYAVLITWFPENAKTEEEAAQDRLGDRYSQIDQPRWEKTVTAGGNKPQEFVFIVR